MCGICGIHDLTGVDRADLAKMVDALRHRGPDDSGMHLSGCVGLGHRRLSIIDLATGRQPMSNEDGTVWITFNGEIYNYRSLRRSLEGRHEFKTSSDTEVILHLFEEQGEGCVRHLRGMFAFAIYDSRDDTLLVARDHLGQKPLYYEEGAARFRFASELGALLAVDPSLREMDRAALYEYLVLRIITAPRSMFRRIRKLPPAHYLVYRGGRVSVSRYWEPRHEPKVELDFHEALDELERRVLDAVECHLVSDVPVGAFLSGGVDSSLVVAMMSRFTDGPIKTFTGDLPYRDHSEVPYARLVSKRFGTTGHELTITPSRIRALPRVIGHLGEPSDPLAICLYLLAEFTRKELKVVLGGDGGDELFGGYDRYYAFRYAGLLRWVPRPVRELFLGSLSRGSWYRGMEHRVRWLIEMSRYEGAERYSKSLGYFYFAGDERRGLFTPEFSSSVGLFDPEENIRACFDAPDYRDALDRMLYTDSCTRLPDHPVMILDRMTMAHGLEARSPFLDHELAGFCATLPSHFKTRGTRRRIIQMALAGRHLPAAILERDKQGFSSAFTYMVTGPFNRLYREFLGDSRLVETGHVEGDAIRALLEEHVDGRADHGQRLWLLFNSELWYRMFIESEGHESIEERIDRILGEEAPVAAVG